MKCQFCGRPAIHQIKHEDGKVLFVCRHCRRTALGTLLYTQPKEGEKQ